MKCYHWINSYTTGGQNSGIQTAHAQVGMIKEFYGEDSTVEEWMDDKTTVVLKGGMHGDLMQIKALLSHGYIPWYAFHESEYALNGALTNICCLPTQRLLDAAAALRAGGKNNFIYLTDGSIVMQVTDKGYYTIDKRYRDMMLGSCLDFPSNIERVRHCIKTETFTMWESELIKLIAEGRTA